MEKLVFGDFSEGEKEEWKKIVKLKSYNSDSVKELAKCIISIISQTIGKSSQLKEELRCKVMRYVSTIDFKKMNELVNSSHGFGVEVDLFNLLNPRIDEYWKLYHFFCSYKEEDEEFEGLMKGL